MIKVYVAGAISSTDTLQFLDNVRKGMRAGLKVLLAGYSPFVSFFDFMFQFMVKGKEKLTINDLQRYCMAWLEVSDVVYVTKGWEDSKGTKAEIERAKELDIPIVYSIKELNIIRKKPQ